MRKPTTRSWIANAKRRLNLWLLLVLFLFGGACLIAVNLLSFVEMAQFRFMNLCESARSAYQRGGPAELAAITQSAELSVGLRPYLVDPAGRDLANGEDRTALLAGASERPPLPLFPPRQGVVVERTGKGACVVVMRPQATPARRPMRGRPGFLSFPLLWFLPFLALLCGTVAVYVTVRMRRIETAVAHFGSGRLGVRMEPDARDPFGRLSKTFNEMADRIESLVESHRRLCLDISHELRSPLTRLRLSVGLARSGTPGALEKIELEATRLNDLVDQLLDVTRAEVDPANFRTEPVDLRSLLVETADRCEIEAREKGCRIQVDVTFPGKVDGDPELLRRAIENIVRNAIRHSPGRAAIELSAHTEQESVVIAVIDRGPGVPDDALEAIFEPFYRVNDDRGRGTGGTGLGLSIARRAILLHHGRVTAKNQRPGLRVEIRIPRH